jgi:D-threo-aldose 1-dehydrogenase
MVGQGAQLAGIAGQDGGGRAELGLEFSEVGVQLGDLGLALQLRSHGEPGELRDVEPGLPRSAVVGTSTLGNMPSVYGYEVGRERALETLRKVFDSAVKLVDTSNGYGGGDSERLLGEVLRERGGVPEGVLVSTKVDPDLAGDFSGARVPRSVAESCERLGMSYLPLLFFHDPERTTFVGAMARDGAVPALVKLKEEGAVGHLGVAGGPVGLMERYVRTGAFEVLLTHNRFTLLDRSASSLLDECARLGVSVLNAAPFGGGMRNLNVRLGPRVADELDVEVSAMLAGQRWSEGVIDRDDHPSVRPKSTRERAEGDGPVLEVVKRERARDPIDRARLQR